LRKFDVVVVGAGTAGCMTAKTAAEAGLDVCLVERKQQADVGKKICGDAIGRHHFEELGLEKPKGEEMERKILGIKIYSPDAESTFEVRGEGLHGYLLNRQLFGQRLLKLALDAGATFLDRTQALEPVIEGGFVKGLLVRNLKTEEKTRLSCSVAVDASGFSAVLRRSLPREMKEGIEVHREDVEVCFREIRQLRREMDDTDFCEIYLDLKVAPGGYAWIFPKAGTKVNVGLGVAMKGKFPNPREQLYRHVLSKPLFEGSTVIDKGTWYVPTRRPLDTMVGNGFILVGDAACQVNPIHGGGMGPSMGGGMLAGETIAAALEKGDVSLEGLWPYNHRYMQWYGVKQAGLDVFRFLLQTCTNEDLDYGMKYELITEQDLLRASMGGETRFNITDITRRVFRGLRRLSFLRRLKATADLMKRVRAWYRNYPTSPREFSRWKKGADDLFEVARSKVAGAS